MTLKPIDEAKKKAGLLAAQSVQAGMRVGLGTGSTVFFTIEELARRRREEGLVFEAVSTSFSTSLLCANWGIPLLDLGQVSSLDLAVDGADEIDPARNLIKGRGAAHTLEKIVARMATQLVIVADDSKKVARLGTKMPVPVEFMPSARSSVERHLRSLGAQDFRLRMATSGKDGPVISDNGLFLADALFDGIDAPAELEKAINAIPGVLDNGIFAGLCTQALVASENGVEVLR